MSMRFLTNRFKMADTNNTSVEGSEISQDIPQSPAKSRGKMWKDEEVLDLIDVMNEETILISIDNAKTPKEKRACYTNVHVQLQKKGD